MTDPHAAPAVFVPLAHEMLDSLTKLMKSGDFERAARLWRHHMERSHTPCRACPGGTLGEKCCCQCLETSIHHNALNTLMSVQEYEDIRQALADFGDYRLDACTLCDDWI
ncbi:MAG: hypothetical protein HQL36_01065 [Alphaproteobacteria bacterium]|nr:hypothetical protein [Alphaproteobacteria bacterium]MBF0251813.1 hypothetical protein [Alphaproteobacteria bacterium]